MASVNKVILIGNLTRDPEVRYTPKGSAVTEISLAINRQYSLDNGEKREEVIYVDVTLWGRLAEIAAQYLTKGRPVYIEGRLKMDTWDDKQTGQKRSKMGVVAESLQLLGSRGEGGAPRGGGSGGEHGEYEQDRPPRSQAPSQRPAPSPRRQEPMDPDLQPEEDDIPF